MSVAAMVERYPSSMVLSLVTGLGFASFNVMAIFMLRRTDGKTAADEAQESSEDELELAENSLDSHLTGLEHVFSIEVIRTKRVSAHGTLRKYTFAVGLPNVANTCYMNSLLQALSGCTHFTRYMDRLWDNIEIDENSDDEIAVYFFVRTVRELKDGT